MLLPTGRITFLFTDIEGSTRLWEQHAAQMRPALARHDSLLRDVIDRNGGYFVKSMGDGILAAFSRVIDAIHAALEAQRALLSGVGLLRSLCGGQVAPGQAKRICVLAACPKCDQISRRELFAARNPILVPIEQIVGIMHKVIGGTQTQGVGIVLGICVLFSLRLCNHIRELVPAGATPETWGGNVLMVD